jgi:hypothetical protein
VWLAAILCRRRNDVHRPVFSLPRDLERIELVDPRDKLCPGGPIVYLAAILRDGQVLPVVTLRGDRVAARGVEWLALVADAGSPAAEIERLRVLRVRALVRRNRHERRRVLRQRGRLRGDWRRLRALERDEVVGGRAVGRETVSVVRNLELWSAVVQLC